MVVMRKLAPLLLVLGLAACSGVEDRAASRTASGAVTARHDRWRFVDAFAALRSPEPGKRLEAAEWIGANLRTHPVLSLEALRAAAADESPDVASRARQLLSGLGEKTEKLP